MKMKKTSTKAALPIELSWTHCGAIYRVTAWPEAACERRVGEGWAPVELDAALLASAAVSLDSAAWGRYLEYVPAEERAFLERFRFGRMGALWVITRCPALFGIVRETPALAMFLAAHMGLRGTPAPRWGEIAAVFERGEVFGVLEWLGLPASRLTLTVLQHVLDPDVPQRLLEPLRTSLWEPAKLVALQGAAVLTDRELARCCHPLAA